MGYDIFAGVGEQSAYATAVARTSWSRVYSDSDLNHIRPNDPRAHLGRLDPDELFYQLERGEGQLVVPLHYDTSSSRLLDLMFKHALGGRVHAGAGPSYTHTYSLADSLPANGLTVELHKGFPDSGDESKILTGGKVRNMTITARVNEETQASFGLLGRKVDTGAKTASPTYVDLDTYAVNPPTITVDIDATTTNVFGVEINLDNILRDDRGFLGQQYIAEPVRGAGKRQITGTISKEWESKAILDKFIAGSTANLVIDAAGPTNYAWEIRLEKIRYVEPTEETTEIDEIPQEIPFVAFYDATYTALQITQTNELAS